MQSPSDDLQMDCDLTMVPTLCTDKDRSRQNLSYDPRLVLRFDLWILLATIWSCITIRPTEDYFREYVNTLKVSLKQISGYDHDCPLFLACFRQIAHLTIHVQEGLVNARNSKYSLVFNSTRKGLDNATLLFQDTQIISDCRFSHQFETLDDYLYALSCLMTVMSEMINECPHAVFPELHVVSDIISNSLHLSVLYRCIGLQKVVFELVKLVLSQPILRMCRHDVWPHLIVLGVCDALENYSSSPAETYNEETSSIQFDPSLANILTIFSRDKYIDWDPIGSIVFKTLQHKTIQISHNSDIRQALVAIANILSCSWSHEKEIDGVINTVIQNMKLSNILDDFDLGQSKTNFQNSVKSSQSKRRRLESQHAKSYIASDKLQDLWSEWQSMLTCAGSDDLNHVEQMLINMAKLDEKFVGDNILSAVEELHKLCLKNIMTNDISWYCLCLALYIPYCSDVASAIKDVPLVPMLLCIPFFGNIIDYITQAVSESEYEEDAFSVALLNAPSITCWDVNHCRLHVCAISELPFEELSIQIFALLLQSDNFSGTSYFILGELLKHQSNLTDDIIVGFFECVKQRITHSNEKDTLCQYFNQLFCLAIGTLYMDLDGAIYCRVCYKNDAPAELSERQEQILNAWIKSWINVVSAKEHAPEDIVSYLKSLLLTLCHVTPISAYLKLDEWDCTDIVIAFLAHNDPSVRTTAANVLVRFLNPILDPHISENNEAILVNELVALAERGSKSLDVIRSFVVFHGLFASSTVLEVCDYHQKSLRFLIQQTGSPNPIMQSLAYHEISRIALAYNISTSQLISYNISEWSVLAVNTGKLHGPVLKSLALLFSGSTNEFLDQTCQHTLPYLVEHERTGLLKDISKDLKIKLGDLVVVKNGDIVISHLLLSNKPKEDALFEYFLKLVGEDLENGELLKSIIAAHKYNIVCHLVVELGSETNKSNASNALLYVANMLTPNGKRTDTISQLINDHILSILTFFNSAINKPQFAYSTTNKKKLLASLKELMRICSDTVTSVVPQIMGVLQTSLDDKLLWDASLECWKAFLLKLGIQELKDLFGQISVILLRIQPMCTPEQNTKLVQIFDSLIIDNQNASVLIVELMCELPDEKSWSYIKDVVDFYKKPDDPWAEERLILSNLSNENAVVVEKAVKTLKKLLAEKQMQFYAMILNERIESIVKDIIHALFETCRKYNNVASSEISRTCCECLGVLGAPDPARLDIVLEADAMFGPKWDLATMNEATDFACTLIKSILVPTFKATHNSLLQGYFAYAIQELLKFCGFTEDLIRTVNFRKTITQNRKMDMQELERQSKLKSIWETFPRSVINTIEPLTASKYTTGENTLLLPQTYPIFPRCADFNEWIENFALQTFDRVDSDFVQRLFNIFRFLIRAHDTNIAQLLLPHAVLNVLRSTKKNYSDDILCEFIYILNSQVPEADSRISEKYHLSVQFIFNLFDHLTKWIRLKRMHVTRQRAVAARDKNHASVSKTMLASVEALERQIDCIESWLEQIPQPLIAQASVRCKSYARALKHYEQHLRHLRKIGNEDEMQRIYDELQKVYAKLGDADGLQLMTSLLSNVSLDQKIIEHETLGRWSDAQTCYELASQVDPDKVEYQIGLLRCLHHLGHFESLLTHINGIDERATKEMQVINSQGIEAAWRLGDWSSLEMFLSRPHKPDFPTRIGNILYALKVGKFEDVSKMLNECRSDLTTSIAAASMESYQKAYDASLQLSMLQEIESFKDDLFANNGDSQSFRQSFSNLLDMWGARLKLLYTSFRTREPILNLRRILLQLLSNHRCATSIMPKIKQETGNLWLQTAKEARKSGYQQTAYGAILHATRLEAPLVHIEHAKMLWTEGHRHQAMSELRNSLKRKQVSFSSEEEESSTMMDERITTRMASMVNAQVDKSTVSFLHARASLLETRWTEETNGLGSTGIIAAYRQITKEQPCWEKSAFFMGRYYKLIHDNEITKINNPKTNVNVKYSTIVLLAKAAVVQYCCSLLLGTKYIYEALPRLLTLWLDYGNVVTKYEAIIKSGGTQKELEEPKLIVNAFASMHKAVKKLSSLLTTYMFLTAISQLISRIDHRNTMVQQTIEHQILQVLSVYPQQTIWHLVAVRKSTVRGRSDRVKTIFDKFSTDGKWSLNRPGIRMLLIEAMGLVDHLLNVCNCKVPPDSTSLKLSDYFRITKGINAPNMIIPTQSSMTVTLPSSVQTINTHKPFPSNLPTINSVVDEVEIMPSLQRPRKIKIIGSNGAKYIFLCKPADDLRKDSRLMEFNSLINKLLKKDAEARKRGLFIRTYSVIPLNEECGLIEWVTNTVGFRHILTKSYRAKNLLLSHGDIKRILERKGRLPIDAFVKDLLPRFPPVFHEWFLEMFPEPSKWMTSRKTYAGTTAVMSMVGHIVGLGDRHGENILFDELTGACLHVDLNCLFEKGLEFEKPEKVPFRLTQNMVDAFGLGGVEGVFRKSCEASLKVLMDNRDSLMAVLETFLHDPLCEWTKMARRHRQSHPSNTADSEQTENERANKILWAVNHKLEGYLSTVSLPLSSQGLANELINQAIDPKNLSEMYIGWAAYW